MNPFTTNSARLLTDEQLQKTHEASLEILQEVGMEVHNGTAREVYARHGCDVDNEISLMLKRVARGVEVSKENISLDEIIEMGPGSMSLETEQTFARMEDTALFPDVADRDTRQAWEEKGGHDAWGKSLLVAKEIIERQGLPYFSPEVDKEIRSQFENMVPGEVLIPEGW